MIPRKPKICEGCGQSRPLWKSNPPTCKKCALTNSKPLKRTPLSKGLSDKAKAQIDADTAFYIEIWQERKHECEECSIHLGDTWQRFMFSHLLSKGAHPKLRLVKLNISLVCLPCHTDYEFGSRNKMKMREEWNKRIVQLLNMEINQMRNK